MVNDQLTTVGTQQIHHSGRAIDLLGRAVGIVSSAPNPVASGAMRVVASVGHHYDSRNRRMDALREDGTHWEYGYNDRSEITAAARKLTDNQLVPGQSFGYNYDCMGNRTSSSAGTAPGVATTNYTPDALNRYTSITTPGITDVLMRSSNTDTSVTIDGSSATLTQRGDLCNAHSSTINNSNGKFYDFIVTSGGSTQTGHRWIAPATLQLQSSNSSSPGLKYDADGNLTQDGRWIYTWDAENRLVQMTTLQTAINAGAPALTLNFAYDYMGRRIRKTVTTVDANNLSTTTEETTLYQGWNPVATLSGGNVTKTLLWGLDLSGSTQGAGGVGGLLLVNVLGSNAATYYPSYDTNGNI